MRKAIAEARKGYGNTGPNPLVGAIVIKDGKVLSKSYHKKVGEAHAEARAIEEAGEAARGADLVVTLEPCSHQGRTPPCVERILQAGIRRVVVGTLDPNPRERGRGIEILRSNGVEVLTGIEEEACRRMDEPYFKYITTGLPYVILKLATSLDGRIATRTGDSQWFSSPPFIRFVHRLRRDSNAVMVGARTQEMDNPRLTVRQARPQTNPLRVLLSTRLNVSPEHDLFCDQERTPTVVFHSHDANQETARKLQDKGVRLEAVGEVEGKVDLKAVLKRLGQYEVSRLLVEGGGQLGGALLDQELVDRLVVAYAPVVVGSAGMPAFGLPGPDRLADARRYHFEWTRRIGEDLVAVVRVGPDYARLMDDLLGDKG